MCKSTHEGASGPFDLATVKPGQSVRIATLGTHFFTLTATNEVQPDGDEIDGFSVMTNFLGFYETEAEFAPGGIRMQRFLEIDKSWWIGEGQELGDIIWAYSIV